MLDSRKENHKGQLKTFILILIIMEEDSRLTPQQLKSV